MNLFQLASQLHCRPWRIRLHGIRSQRVDLARTKVVCKVSSRKHWTIAHRIKAKKIAHSAALRQQAFFEGKVDDSRPRWRIVQLMSHWHKKEAIRFEEQRAKEAKERLGYLKACNFEEYLKLVQKTKSTRIHEILAKTDHCLRTLTTRLHGGTQKSALQLNKNHGIDGAKIMDLKESTSAWDCLAEKLQADISSQPPLLTGGQLSGYQMQGLRWMVGLHQHGMNGILADEMGLGKTIQVIALLAHLHEKGTENAPYLIITPATLLDNWENELRKWAPSVVVFSHKGKAESRLELLDSTLQQKRRAFSVLLTTYELVMGKFDTLRFSKIKWEYIIVDEGHRLKNVDCKLVKELKKFKSRHRLLLTGTPLQNDIKELWALLNFLMPNLFDSGGDFKEWFAPDLEGTSLDVEETMLITTRLHQVLRPFMLRRLKEHVMKELPEKVIHTIKVPPSAYQQALNKMLEVELTIGLSRSVGTVKGVNNIVMELRNVANHPMISRMHIDGSEQDLPKHPLPPEVRLCSKLEVLDRILLKLHAAKHKV
eukprot:jgi/Botrbrau1/11821/Bobra.0224s0018.1